MYGCFQKLNSKIQITFDDERNYILKYVFYILKYIYYNYNIPSTIKWVHTIPLLWYMYILPLKNSDNWLN